ncbi:MAG: Ig-like domain-containing protein, partial [Myxococcota bacterium]
MFGLWALGCTGEGGGTTTPSSTTSSGPTTPAVRPIGNAPPQISVPRQTLPFRASIEFDTLEFAYDEDGDPLFLAVIDPPRFGTVTDLGSGRLRYTHTGPGDVEDAIHIEVSDGFGRVPSSVQLDILSEPALSILSPGSGQVVPAGNVPVQFAVSGCYLGSGGDLGCRIDARLNGGTVSGFGQRDGIVLTEINGPTTLSVELVWNDGTPLAFAAPASVTWTTVDGRETYERPGDLTVATPQAMQDFCDDGFTVVLGSLTLPHPVTDLSALSCLERVDGDLFIDSRALTSLALPSLREVGGRIELGTDVDLTALELPALEVTEWLGIGDRPSLASVDLRSLRDVTGTLWFDGLPALTDVQLGSLLTVAHHLRFVDLPSLATIALPALRTVVGDVRVERVAASDFDAPILEDVGGSLSLVWLGSEGVAATLDLSSLTQVGGDLSMSSVNVVDVSMPGLAFVGGELEARLSRMDSWSSPQLAEIGGNVDLYRVADLATVDLSGLRR